MRLQRLNYGRRSRSPSISSIVGPLKVDDLYRGGVLPPGAFEYVPDAPFIHLPARNRTTWKRLGDISGSGKFPGEIDVPSHCRVTGHCGSGGSLVRRDPLDNYSYLVGWLVAEGLVVAHNRVFSEGPESDFVTISLDTSDFKTALSGLAHVLVEIIDGLDQIRVTYP